MSSRLARWFNPVNWALSQEDQIRLGEWLLKTPLGPPLLKTVEWLDRQLRRW
jgi:hypothetical protein